VPAVGQRGTARAVELIGYGIVTGKCELERVTRNISFPADPQRSTFTYRLETELGRGATFELGLSDLAETIEPGAGSAANSETTLTLPVAITGTLNRQSPRDRFRLSGKQGEIWSVAAHSRRLG